MQKLDARLSHSLAVPRSIKTASVKPSGNVSLLAGATSGVHWEHTAFYLRRVRIPDRHPLVAMCRSAGYQVEPDRYAPATAVIAFPIHVPHAGKRKADVPLRQKIELAAQMQRHWFDNQVSSTADFNPDTEGAQLAGLLRACERRLKEIALLPTSRRGYEHAPYEEITQAQYEQAVSGLKPLNGGLEHAHELDPRFCEGGAYEFGEPP